MRLHRLRSPKIRINTGFNMVTNIKKEWFPICYGGYDMAEVSAKDIPIESQFMTDFWSFRKKYYVPEDRDEYWSELVSAADELYNKYPYPYFEKMILNCAEDIDKRYKKQIREKQNE